MISCSERCLLKDSRPLTYQTGIKVCIGFEHYLIWEACSNASEPTLIALA
ncbi:uncharacterized protein METZ01_LOCUS153931 [marine metagenome]|uniref:Uncharacterized protein n=1 Tax=marine metagenome TaxID=408172 RepID=A0A382AJ95_9ZZZZ